MSYYQQRRIVLTGAASGLGRLFSLKLRDVDCSLYLVDRNLDGLKQLLNELEGGRCWAEIIECDLTDIQAARQ